MPVRWPRPQLLVVVDTEEEFDWALPFDRAARTTASISSQGHAHALFDRYGVVPTYVMDYPVATAPAAARYLRGLVDAGRADFGAHCHPWVTPPHQEAVSNFNSFHGNLNPRLEAAKIATTTRAVTLAMERSPTIFKAGRYGIGPHTLQTLIELGYTLDCSFVPHTSFAASEGPDFTGTPEQPFFVDAERRLLEVPLTVGWVGALAPWQAALQRPLPARLRLPGIVNRLGLLERTRLTPEGHSAAQLCRLLRQQVAAGLRVFTLSYHSPSLAPGHTPYVRDAAALQVFLATLEATLRCFRDELGGEFTTLAAVEAHVRRGGDVATP